MNMPLVSIVTPSYNQGRFIQEAIDSVLSQDYPLIEYLVVDGGSDDETLDVLRGYGTELRWISEPDRGQADAINKGFRRTHGQILGWLNADDVYKPGAVLKAVQVFLAHPEIGLVYGLADEIDENGVVITEALATFSFDFDRLLNRGDYITQPATFFRREPFEQIDGLNANLHWSLDYDLWLRLARHTGARLLPVHLASSRVHETTKTMTGALPRLEEIEGMIREHGRSRIPRDFYIPLWKSRTRALIEAVRTKDWAASREHLYRLLPYVFLAPLERLSQIWGKVVDESARRGRGKIVTLLELTRTRLRRDRTSTE